MSQEIPNKKPHTLGSFLIDLIEQSILFVHRGEGGRGLAVVGLFFLSAEEAGLLLSDAVFSLGERELGTVPPATQRRSR